jgi:hypothetical protein
MLLRTKCFVKILTLMIVELSRGQTLQLINEKLKVKNFCYLGFSLLHKNIYLSLIFGENKAVQTLQRPVL